MDNRRQKLVYVIGPLSAKTKKARDANVKKAQQAAMQIWDAGFTAICPHLNTLDFYKNSKKTQKEDMILGSNSIIKKCDAVFLLKDWEKSEGSKKEKEFAEKSGKAIIYSFEGLERWDAEGKMVYGRKKKSSVNWVGILLGIFAGIYFAQSNYAISLLFLILIALEIIVMKKLK